MNEITLFRREDRYPVPISSFAVPSDISIFHNHFGDHSYYADYAGIARQQAATTILEIGVRYGYSGIAMCLGALSVQPDAVRFAIMGIGTDVNAPTPPVPLHYLGLDAEFFGGYMPHDPGTPVGSHTLARAHFRQMIPGLTPDLRTCDTRNGLPKDLQRRESAFDLINVDGDHSYEGAFRDMEQTWPLLTPGGIMLIDDTGMEEVKRAIRDRIAAEEQAGTLDAFQWYANERGMCIMRKVG